MAEETMEPSIERRVAQSQMLSLYRIFSSVMAILMLGVISWMALNVSHIPLIELRIDDLNLKFDDRAQRLETEVTATSKWQADKLNDHEIRIRALEVLKK